jgi:hypothetical protein
MALLLFWLTLFPVQVGAPNTGNSATCQNLAGQPSNNSRPTTGMADAPVEGSAKALGAAPPTGASTNAPVTEPAAPSATPLEETPQDDSPLAGALVEETPTPSVEASTADSLSAPKPRAGQTGKDARPKAIIFLLVLMTMSMWLGFLTGGRAAPAVQPRVEAVPKAIQIGYGLSSGLESSLLASLLHALPDCNAMLHALPEFNKNGHGISLASTAFWVPSLRALHEFNR